MTPIRSFYAFLEAHVEDDADFFERVKRAGVNIESLNELLKFARQRWPDHYSSDWRKSTEGMQYGKEAMKRKWSEHLNWREVGG